MRALLLLLFFGAACGGFDGYETGGGALSYEASYAGVNALIDERCANCHGYSPGAGGLQLPEDLDRDLIAETGALVQPGQPDTSLLWQVLQSGRMPSGRQLPVERIDHVRVWIEAGAPMP